MILVDFEAFWGSLADDLSRARHSVYLQTFALEGDSVGLRLAAALAACPAPDRRILADWFTRVIVSDRLLLSPCNLFRGELRREVRATRSMVAELRARGAEVRYSNPFGWSLGKIFGRNHKKIIVIDERVAYLGGMNFSEHNASWHDVMVRLEHRGAADFLAQGFRADWVGRSQAATVRFPDIELHSLDGQRNSSGFEPVLQRLDLARSSIFVESPYVTYPFYERLKAAARRGVRVTLVAPERNNLRGFGRYARLEGLGSGLEVRLYTPRMSHLKAMLIDEECLILGSSNFDYLSYRTYQEIVAVLSDPELIRQFQSQIVAPDMAASRPLSGAQGPLNQFLSAGKGLLYAFLNAVPLSR